MPIPKSDKIWMDGEFVDWDDAKIHVCAHVVHYGTCVFEGIRCYNTEKGPAIFRLEPHIKRLYNSAKMYRMEPEMPREEFMEACFETIRTNGMKECYIRPVVYRGYNELGVNPFNNPINAFIVVWEWGKYLGPEALEQGVDVMVSTWDRIAPNTFPALAKTGANYMNSQLIKMEAIKNGYVEGIALDSGGYVSEGSGENIFLIEDETIFTPPLGASVLPGITRNTVIDLARDLGYEVIEKLIPREMLYIADEVFFTGTAAEISPIRSVDKIQVGEGKRGPITKKLQDIFFKVLNAEVEERMEWLDFVYKD
ncbi:MAG: branched-chain amino acid transaminase [Candidatus Latescibacteria bacterium]|nr:branched-chain amino acid transaminase [bacterium]MBD3425014.1 branched-chain amino acid transaminase [Candidatus Latescibacterota bacterium]